MIELLKINIYIHLLVKFNSLNLQNFGVLRFAVVPEVFKIQNMITMYKKKYFLAFVWLHMTISKEVLQRTGQLSMKQSKI